MSEPGRAQADATEAVAEALYDLLHARALSIGLLDISVEVDGWYVDAELMFSSDPDMGLSYDAGAGACAYCRLVRDDAEEWLDDAALTALPLPPAADADAARDLALAVLSGLLDARRPFLTKVDTPPAGA